MDLPEDAAHGFVRLHQNIQILSRENQMEEFMFLGLRMTEGIKKTDFNKTFNRDYNEIYGTIDELLKNNGLIDVESDTVKLTARGLDISNTVLSRYLLD